MFVLTMTKEMRETQEKLKAKMLQAQALMQEAKHEEAAVLMDEMDELQKAFDLQKRVHEHAKSFVPDELEDTQKTEKPTGFALIAKLLRNEAFTPEDLEVITPAKAMLTGANAVNGESYIIPEDVRTGINNMRQDYKSARELIGHFTTQSLTGSIVIADSAPAGLIDFTDGDAIPAGTEPEFKNRAFAIKLKGMLIPVSNVLTLTETGGLLAYLNHWFLQNAVFSENTDIFAALAQGKTAKALVGLDALRTSINVDLSRSAKKGAVIVTNQTGFEAMDAEKDANGRGLLQPDPTDATRKVFKGIPIEVFDDVELPNVGGKAPIYYGNLKRGAVFIELIHLFIASSSHSGFRSNQTELRVIEGYDVMQFDSSAYLYGTFEPVSPII